MKDIIYKYLENVDEDCCPEELDMMMEELFEDFSLEDLEFILEADLSEVRVGSGKNIGTGRKGSYLKRSLSRASERVVPETTKALKKVASSVGKTVGKTVANAAGSSKAGKAIIAGSAAVEAGIIGGAIAKEMIKRKRDSEYAKCMKGNKSGVEGRMSCRGKADIRAIEARINLLRRSVGKCKTDSCKEKIGNMINNMQSKKAKILKKISGYNSTINSKEDKKLLKKM